MRPIDDKAAPSRGFTLVEVQVAIIVLVLVLLTVGGQNRVYNQLLSGHQADKRVAGYFDVGDEVAYLSISGTGSEAAPPPCDVGVQSVEMIGGYPRVTVVVEQGSF